MNRFRIAPTPSGYLHLGNGVNFVLTAAWAKHLQAELVLRIDDLDQARTRPEYKADIADTLRWLFPNSAINLLAHVYQQSQRTSSYLRVLELLRDNELVYACNCSRKDIRLASSGDDAGNYPGTCRDRGLFLDAPDVAWRLRLPGPRLVHWLEGLDAGSASESTVSEDFVVRQRNSAPAYQLASLTDDVELGITHIVRGQDLWDSTARQLVLAKALEAYDSSFSAFAKTRFWHHPLLRTPAGEKLSKSAGSTSLRDKYRGGASSTLVYAQAQKLLTEATGGGPDESWVLGI